MQLAALDDEPFAQRLEHPRCNPLGLACVGDAVQQHRELVAAESRGRVARAHERVDPRGDALQQSIAGAVSETVVDRLEVVEIDEQHRYRTSAAQPGCQRVPEPVFEQRPVRQARERVVECLMPQLVLHRDPLADVPHVEHQPADRRIGEAVLGHDLHVNPTAVGVAQADAHLPTGASSSHSPQERVEQQLIVRVRHRGDRGVQPRTGLDAEQATHRSCLPAHAQITSQHHHDFARVIHERADPLLAAALHRALLVRQRAAPTHARQPPTEHRQQRNPQQHRAD